MAKDKDATTELPTPFAGDYGSEVIYMLAATGLTPPEISKSSGVPIEMVKKALGKDVARDRIRALQDQLFGKDLSKRFKALAHKAVNAIEDIVSDGAIKPTTRLAAASEILDRAIGKPKQFIEHSDGNLRDLYDKMDEVIRTRTKPGPVTVEVVRVESPAKVLDTNPIQIAAAEDGTSKDLTDDEVEKWLKGRKEKAP